MRSPDTPSDPLDDPLSDPDDNRAWLESMWPQLDPALEQGPGMPPTVPQEDDR